MFINIPGSGSPSWQFPVTTFTALPSSGNAVGDVRVTLDTDESYIWNGTSWVTFSGSTSWGAITGTLSNQTDLQNALNSKTSGSGTSGQVAVWNGATSETGYTGLTSDTLGNLIANSVTVNSSAGFASLYKQGSIPVLNLSNSQTGGSSAVLYFSRSNGTPSVP